MRRRRKSQDSTLERRQEASRPPGWTSHSCSFTSSPCTVVGREGNWVAAQAERAERSLSQRSKSPQGADGVLRQTEMLHHGERWQLAQTHHVVLLQVEHFAPAQRPGSRSLHPRSTAAVVRPGWSLPTLAGVQNSGPSANQRPAEASPRG